jgi:hypothetical protein
MEVGDLVREIRSSVNSNSAISQKQLGDMANTLQPAKKAFFPPREKQKIADFALFCAGIGILNQDS